MMGLLLTTSIQSWATPSIEIALLLDSSGSMSGLINKTREKIWALMNDLENARKDGEVPSIDLALYSYGNPSNPDAVNEIVQISELTTDHDELFVEFQKLTTSGGDELAGTVVTQALNELSWDSSGDFKAIFLAGNETLKQGAITIESAAAQAVQQDTFLNTIYAAGGSFRSPARIPNNGTCRAHICPSPSQPQPQPPVSIPDLSADPVKQEWQAAALAGNGSFAHIDHNATSVHIDAPQDKLILKLDKELNTTFVPYGKNGIDSYNRMINIDGSIGSTSIGSMVGRGRYKVGHNYDTSKWDLVDAYNKGKVKLAELTNEDLPRNLQGFSEDQILQYLEKMNAKRVAIKAQTTQLYKEREEYITKKKEELRAQGQGDELETAMIASLRAQLTAKGFSFNN